MNPEDEHLHETVDAMLRAAPEPHPYDTLGAQRLGETEWDGMEIGTVEPVDDPLRHRDRRGGPAQLALVTAVVLALVGGIWGISSLNGGDDARRTATRKILTTPAAKALFAALGASTGTGGYEVNYEFTITPPATPPTTVCGNPHISYGSPTTTSAPGSATPTVIIDGASSATYANGCVGVAGRAPVTVTGHGKVFLNPYSLETTSTVTGLGEVAVRTDGNLIAEAGGANYGKIEDGQPISGFSSAVQATFGQGPGALTMLGLASPTGYLSLSANAVTNVTAAGTGTVNGAPVTYYDVVSDVNAMRDLPGLTDEQRKVIDQSLQTLEQAGFKEATAHIAVDAAGYIVESSSKATFADGTTMNRHMTLSKFGCIGTGPTPAHPDGVPEPAPSTCAPSPATVTTTVPTAPAAEPSTTTTSPAVKTSIPGTGDATTSTTVPCLPPTTDPAASYACAF